MPRVATPTERWPISQMLRVWHTFPATNGGVAQRENRLICRPLAQLEEFMLYTHEVTGSSPVWPITGAGFVYCALYIF